MAVEGDYSLTYEQVQDIAKKSEHCLVIEKRYPYGYTAKIKKTSIFPYGKSIASVDALTYQGAIKKGRRLYSVMLREPVYVEFFEREEE